MIEKCQDVILSFSFQSQSNNTSIVVNVKEMVQSHCPLYCTITIYSTIIINYSLSVVGNTISPHSAPTFPGTCKRKFLCLQMISFEFLRVDSIG